MKKTYAILFLLVSFFSISQHVDAQKDTSAPLISGDFKDIPVEQFLLALEQHSSYRFYYDTADLDSMKITMSVQGESLYTVLNRAFTNTALTYAVDSRSNIFISKGLAVKTEIPEGFFYDPNRRATSTLAKADSLTDFTEKKEVQVATLENKLYTIGLPTEAPGPGRVNIAGYVHDLQTGEPVIGASIFLENSKTGVITDQYGYYSMSLSKGRHILNIQSLGMKDTRRQVMVYAEGRMNIELQSQVMTLRGVTVSAEKVNLVRNMQMGVQKIDIKAIKQVPVAFGEADVLRVVLTLPGVKSVGEASTGLNVRGGAADQNLILFNDATIYNPSHFFGLFSAFNPEVVKDVQLYKSSIPAKYGGRLSSVLEVNSREGNKKEVTGSAGIGLITSRFNIEGPIKKDKTSFILGGRTTYANWLLKLLPDQYENSKASFYDINFNVSHEINKKNNLYLTAYISKDNFNLNNDTTYGYGNQNISLKWKHVFNNKWYSIVAGGYDYYKYNTGSSRNPVNAYNLNFDVGQAYFKTHFNYYANSKQTIEFGFNTLLYKLNPGTYLPVGAKSLVRPDVVNSEQALESALYISDKYSFTPEFSLEAGLRYSIFNYLGPQKINNYLPGVPKTESSMTGTTDYKSGSFIKTYGGPEIRLAARYAFNNVFSVKAGYNTQRQYIHVMSNTASIAPTDIWKLSDPNIRPQYGDQISLGLYRTFDNNVIETSVEVYYKRIKDYLDYTSGATLLLNHHIETDVINTTGKAYGLEVMIKKTNGKLNGWLSYTYSRTLLKMDDPNIGVPVNKGNFYPANYDKPHDVTMIGNYRVSHRFSTSLNVTYSTGRPITLPIGRFYYGQSERTLYSDRNAYRIPDYFRIDFAMNIEGNHEVHQKTHNSWTIGVYNLSGRKNPYSVYYVSENGRVNGYKMSIFGSAIPYVNFNIRF